MSQPQTTGTNNSSPQGLFPTSSEPIQQQVFLNQDRRFQQAEPTQRPLFPNFTGPCNPQLQEADIRSDSTFNQYSAATQHRNFTQHDARPQVSYPGFQNQFPQMQYPTQQFYNQMQHQAFINQAEHYRARHQNDLSQYFSIQNSQFGQRLHQDSTFQVPNYQQQVFQNSNPHAPQIAGFFKQTVDFTSQHNFPNQRQNPNFQITKTPDQSRGMINFSHGMQAPPQAAHSHYQENFMNRMPHQAAIYSGKYQDVNSYNQISQSQLKVNQEQSSYSNAKSPMIFHPTYSDFVQPDEIHHQIFANAPQMRFLQQQVEENQLENQKKSLTGKILCNHEQQQPPVTSVNSALDSYESIFNTDPSQFFESGMPNFQTMSMAHNDQADLQISNKLDQIQQQTGQVQGSHDKSQIANAVARIHVEELNKSQLSKRFISNRSIIFDFQEMRLDVDQSRKDLTKEMQIQVRNRSPQIPIVQSQQQALAQRDSGISDKNLLHFQIQNLPTFESPLSISNNGESGGSPNFSEGSTSTGIVNSHAFVDRNQVAVSTKLDKNVIQVTLCARSQLDVTQEKADSAFKSLSSPLSDQPTKELFTLDLQKDSAKQNYHQSDISIVKSASIQEQQAQQPQNYEFRKPILSKYGDIGNDIDVYRILEGSEDRTTVMVRNIPNKFRQKVLLELINESHIGQYDYFYLPMDLKTQCNVGYAFINFVHPIYIIDFFIQFQSLEWNLTTFDCKSNKVSKLAFANIQGKDELISHHIDKNIMKKAEDYIRPVILSEQETTQPSDIQIKEIKDRYKKQIDSGDLDKELARLAQMQRRALIVNGPHPHHPNQFENASQLQSEENTTLVIKSHEKTHKSSKRKVIMGQEGNYNEDYTNDHSNYQELEQKQYYDYPEQSYLIEDDGSKAEAWKFQNSKGGKQHRLKQAPHEKQEYHKYKKHQEHYNYRKERAGPFMDSSKGQPSGTRNTGHQQYQQNYGNLYEDVDYYNEYGQEVEQTWHQDQKEASSNYNDYSKRSYLKGSKHYGSDNHYYQSSKKSSQKWIEENSQCVRAKQAKSFGGQKHNYTKY